MSNVIEVNGLVKTFGSASGWFSGRKHEVQAVKGISLHLDAGETLAIAGVTCHRAAPAGHDAGDQRDTATSKPRRLQLQRGKA